MGKISIENDISSGFKYKSYRMYRRPYDPQIQIKEDMMAKGKDVQKSVKKKSEKTLKEKRREKKLKKA